MNSHSHLIKINRTQFIRLAGMLLFFTAANVMADPLPGRDLLKFSQKAMDGTTITNSQGGTQRYWGHDTLSTAYSTVGATGPTAYRGRFMADNFADRIDSPVLHVRWWGSYLNNFVSPNFPVNKFLICFETDVPADASNPFPRPGAPILSQIVQRGPLAAGSGTFTEKPISGGGPPLGETLYEYNAELHRGRAFAQIPNKVYWLKIVALVDLPAGIIIDPNQPPTFVPRWGWHSRDYRIMNGLASTPPDVIPGEHINGFLGPVALGQSVWQFQSPAVTGSVVADHLSTPDGAIAPLVTQSSYQRTFYLDLADGPSGISSFGMDLAFELYALGAIPNPSVSLIKAVKPALSNLMVGVNYQLQLSGDMVTWTNHGAPFMATSNTMVYPQYWDVDRWYKLFFRAQAAP
jgi:hypothetical protein